MSGLGCLWTPSLSRLNYWSESVLLRLSGQRQKQNRDRFIFCIRKINLSLFFNFAMKNTKPIILLLVSMAAFYPVVSLGKESAITEATAYVKRGEPINVDAIAIGEDLSPQKPLTLLVWRSASRRWTALGSSHSNGVSGFAQVTGNRVLFTFTDTQSLDPGNTYFGTTRSCTANGICPVDVEPDAAVRVIVAL